MSKIMRQPGSVIVFGELAIRIAKAGSSAEEYLQFLKSHGFKIKFLEAKLIITKKQKTKIFILTLSQIKIDYMKIIKSAIQRLKHNYILAGIILFGFSLRFYGVYFDYPSVNFIWDEIYNISHLLEIMTYKTIFLKYFPSPYPFFDIFIHSICYS